jgi:hypothetical protein
LKSWWVGSSPNSKHTPIYILVPNLAYKNHGINVSLHWSIEIQA